MWIKIWDTIKKLEQHKETIRATINKLQQDEETILDTIKELEQHGEIIWDTIKKITATLWNNMGHNSKN